MSREARLLPQPSLPRLFAAQQAAEPQHAPARRQRLIGLGLLFAVLLIYAQTASFDFIRFDDPASVTQNPFINRGITAEGVRWAFTDAATFYWQPLTYLSHMLDVTLFGLRSGPQHLENALLHGGTAMLLFLLLYRLTGAELPSLLAAALFAFHPMRVESVAWITERNDVLCGLFSVATMWAYARQVAETTLSRNLLTAVMLALALMAKPVAITLPVVLLVLDIWPLRRAGSNWRALIWEKLPLCVLAAGAAMITILGKTGAGAFPSLVELPLRMRVANALVSYATYVVKLFFPYPIAPYYAYATLPTAKIAAAILLLGAITVWIWGAAKRAPWLLAGWLWFLVTLLPSIGLTQAGD